MIVGDTFENLRRFMSHLLTILGNIFISEEEVKVCSISWQCNGFGFLDSKGILLVAYLPKGHTINSQNYAILLRYLRQNIKPKRLGKPTIGCSQQENALVLTSVVTIAAIYMTGSEFRKHSPSSPYFSTSEFHLFLNLTVKLYKHYANDTDVITDVISLHHQEKAFYTNGISTCKQKWLEGFMLTYVQQQFSPVKT